MSAALYFLLMAIYSNGLYSFLFIVCRIFLNSRYPKDKPIPLSRSIPLATAILFLMAWEHSQYWSPMFGAPKSPYLFWLMPALFACSPAFIFWVSAEVRYKGNYDIDELFSKLRNFRKK